VNELLAPLDTGSWEPHVGVDADGQVIGFAPYRLCQFDRVEAVPDISAAISRFLSGHLTPDAYSAARRMVQSAIDAAGLRVSRALAQPRDQLPDEGELEALRENGELLLAYQRQVKPGSDHATVPDYAGRTRHIPLEPVLTPVENAQSYFRRYAKARRAADEVPARITEFESDQAYLGQLAADLALAETRPEIDAVRDALAVAGWMPRPQRHMAPIGGPRRVVVDGFTIYIGRNAHQNEEVTFKQAAPDDLWLHVRGRPGPHVVVKSGGREVPEKVVEHAAELAARCAIAARGGAAVPAERAAVWAVDVTQRRFVRRMPRRHPGMVTYRNERTLWVRACPAS
jgi:predicted ribosome quality control (RQC) complex YloA/Tae2 family protein